MIITMLAYVLVLVALFSSVSSMSIIKTLPGFSGDLPFKLETGYVGVGDLDDVQLFYYFIESDDSPAYDPLVLWLTGGPGCSGFSALVYEIGPLMFDTENSTGYKPKLKLNPYSWTKVANIIFIDAPVGAGYSYAKTWEGYSNMSDTVSAAETYQFLRKWLMNHPKFLDNPLYVAGDSYSGIVLPIIVKEIADGIEAGHHPQMNMKGYVLGNPVTDVDVDFNYRVPFSFRNALISDALYQSMKTNCKGEYVNVDPNNALCVDDVEQYYQCIDYINLQQILEPKCSVTSPPNPMTLKWDSEDLQDSANLLSPPQLSGWWCRASSYYFSFVWANDKTVQDALHVREGSITYGYWERCNRSLADSYTYDVSSSLVYHQNLINSGYRVLIYSGDHDLMIPYLSTVAWIESLNLTVESSWGPWFVNGQIAGYKVDYSSGKYQLTFTTIKGGGHTAPEYTPEECFAMISRWFAFYPL